MTDAVLGLLRHAVDAPHQRAVLMTHGPNLAAREDRHRPVPLIGTVVALTLAAMLITVTALFVGTGVTLCVRAKCAQRTRSGPGDQPG